MTTETELNQATAEMLMVAASKIAGLSGTARYDLTREDRQTLREVSNMSERLARFFRENDQTEIKE